MKNLKVDKSDKNGNSLDCRASLKTTDPLFVNDKRFVLFLMNDV